jgi:rhodanese-related sulfurtransferase
LLTLAIQAAGPGDQPADLRVSLEEFKKLYEAGEVLVIDVRGQGPYEQGHIPGAIWIPADAVGGRVEELKAEKRAIVTYCS